MLKVYIIYIVINIIGNFLIKAFSLIVLRNWKKQKFYYQRINYTMWLIQKQLSRGVHKKRCSENMQQIYRRTPKPKYDFNKVALQLYF